ncbi:MAG: electron transfer flavoprotein subunit beta/FixA family protein [Elusimicrobiaceae bacterium]|nr:electron transfer flavoprotein subunit beta/FixA family protein [Elusimicrobiaceae bacterium]
MNIIVCIKQVPDTAQVQIDPQTGNLIRTGVPSILNPYDHYALEKALAIKSRTGAKVTVLSMGPQQALAVLRLALALGADEGVLLSDRALAGADTWATAYTLATAIKKIGQYDLILCGQMAIDGDTAQTGPEMAYHLGISQLTFCESVDSDGQRLMAKKLMDGGHQIIEADLPILATMTMPADYTPKYPSFLAAHQAQDKPISVWTAADIGADPHKIGLEGSPTRVARIFPPAGREKGEMIRGTAEEMAAKFVEILKKESFVK